MAAPTLADYEYQFKDAGVKLNSSATLPFVDITKITGLDMPSVDSSSADFDGVHGGVFYSKYFGNRTIVIDCDIYASAATADAYCDTLNTNFMPDDIDYPFYFKGAGIAQRYILAKSLGLRYDIDTLRGYGMTKGQIILGAGDIRKYINNADQVMVAGTSYNIVNSGNLNSYPVITIVGAWTVINLFNNTTGKTLTLTSTRIAGDVVIVDFQTRAITVNGVRNSSIVTATNWWDIAANTTTSIKFTVTGTPTTVTAVTKSAWA